MRAQNKTSRPALLSLPKVALDSCSPLVLEPTPTLALHVWMHCSGVLHHALWVFLNPAHTFPSNSFVKFSSECAFCFLLRL